ncbi:hypothetical protein [Rhodosalinus sediminis]|uniref:hypothetical protein n=1 Tax=Rhodosalinus sediminis TaxID=1940533 RepID=UPI0013147DA5|nr:hypothetical protein [Rhodosalinus sediminis]
MSIMLKKSLISVPTLALLSACGGGGGNSSSSDPRADIARVFSDGSGVARVVFSDGAKSLVVTPNVANEVAYFNENNVPDVTTTGDAIEGDEAPGGGITYEGAIIRGNRAANVTAVASPSQDAAIYYIDYVNDGAILRAEGAPHGSLPAGEFTYTGTMVIGL